MKVLTEAEMEFELRERFPGVFAALAEKDREIRRLRSRVQYLKKRIELVRQKAREGRPV